MSLNSLYKSRDLTVVEQRKVHGCTECGTSGYLKLCRPDSVGSHMIMCHKCHATGDVMATKCAAIESWNGDYE